MPCEFNSTPTIPLMGDVVMVEFTVSRDVVEVVADWLWVNGASAVVEAEAPDSLFPDVVSLTADLPTDLAQDLMSDRVTAPALEVVLSARVVGDEDDDHLAAQTWKEFATPVACGRFVLVPDWLGSRDVEPSMIHLRMDPGDAFGSGTHVTTRLCTEAVGRVIGGGESVLDFGCGTGVLGVASAMIGARSVRAVDIDPEAMRVTRMVAELNGVADRVTTVLVGTDDMFEERVSEHEVFDVVFANVLIDVITTVGGGLAGSVTTGGLLVLSGILVEQRARALAAVDGVDGRSHFSVVDEVERDGWLALVLRKT